MLDYATSATLTINGTTSEVDIAISGDHAEDEPSRHFSDPGSPGVSEPTRLVIESGAESFGLEDGADVTRLVSPAQLAELWEEALANG